MKDKKPEKPVEEKKPAVNAADYPDQAEYWKAKKEAEEKK